MKYQHFEHSPRASAAIFRIAKRIYDDIVDYENGDFRDHVERASWTNFWCWHDGQHWEFESGDIYIATLYHARAGDFWL